MRFIVCHIIDKSVIETFKLDQWGSEVEDLPAPSDLFNRNGVRPSLRSKFSVHRSNVKHKATK